MEILATQRVYFAGYKRLAINVVVSGVTNDELQAAAERYLGRERVDAVILFVWSSIKAGSTGQRQPVNRPRRIFFVLQSNKPAEGGSAMYELGGAVYRRSSR